MIYTRRSRQFPTMPNNRLRSSLYTFGIQKRKGTRRGRHTPGSVQTNEYYSMNTRRLCQLFNAIYDFGKFPVDWLTSTFVAQRNTMLKYVRKISLSASRALKAFLKVICKRIYNKCEEK